jgi:hypothetical protein
LKSIAPSSPRRSVSKQKIKYEMPLGALEGVLRMNHKNDARVLLRGFKCMILSLMTTSVFATAGMLFYLVTVESGYLAVLMCILAVMMTVLALIFMYALGLTNRVRTESQEEGK